MIFGSLITINPLGISGGAWIGSLVLVIVWLLFLREKVGLPYANSLMRKYSRSPLLLTSLWCIRSSLIFLVSLLLCSYLFPIRQEYDTLRTRASATVIALDISKSMETDDLLPSRIEYAKNLIRGHTSGIENLGLVIFAGKTFVLSPITRDTSGLDYLIETLSTDTINQSEAETSGTNIGDALLQSATLFDANTPKKHIILITDGRANIGIDPIIATEAIRAQQIPISIIALGSASGVALSQIVDGKREALLDGSGNTINGSVDLETLSRIASMSSGTLLHISKEASEGDIERILGNQTPIDHTNALKGSDITHTLFLIIALLALIHLSISIIFWIRYKTT